MCRNYCSKHKINALGETFSRNFLRRYAFSSALPYKMLYKYTVPRGTDLFPICVPMRSLKSNWIYATNRPQIEVNAGNTINVKFLRSCHTGEVF